MNESLKYALALVAVVFVVLLLVGNLFLMWQIYDRLRNVDSDLLLSRIEKVESQVQMAEALARAAIEDDRSKVPNKGE